MTAERAVRPAAAEPCVCRNRSGVEVVRDHLLACQASFTPPLAARVAIPAYAAKLVARAERFEAWAGPDLIGLVAVYCDAPDRRDAFVTSVSVVPDRTGRGLGRRLLGAAMTHARDLGFARLALSVDRGAGALTLYRALGFAIEGRAGETLRAACDLRRVCDGANAGSASGCGGTQSGSRDDAREPACVAVPLLDLILRCRSEA